MHGRPQIFFQGRQIRHFGCPFQAADDTNANRRSLNALPLLHHKENDPRYCNSPNNALRWHQCFFSVFTSYVFFHTVIYCYHESLPRCITCHRCLRSTVTFSKTHTALSEPLLPCYCYAIKANIKTILP